MKIIFVIYYHIKYVHIFNIALGLIGKIFYYLQSDIIKKNLIIIPIIEYYILDLMVKFLIF